jgi:hypothetical protein
MPCQSSLSIIEFRHKPATYRSLSPLENISAIPSRANSLSKPLVNFREQYPQKVIPLVQVAIYCWNTWTMRVPICRVMNTIMPVGQVEAFLASEAVHTLITHLIRDKSARYVVIGHALGNTNLSPTGAPYRYQHRADPWPLSQEGERMRTNFPLRHSCWHRGPYVLLCTPMGKAADSTAVTGIVKYEAILVARSRDCLDKCRGCQSTDNVRSMYASRQRHLGRTLTTPQS